MTCDRNHTIALEAHHAETIRTFLLTTAEATPDLLAALDTHSLTATQAHLLTVLIAVHLQALTDRGQPSAHPHLHETLTHLDPQGRILQAITTVNLDLSLALG
ncbi:hypothetical protein [Deinococcus maricopensis]|uniref:Putative ABC transporter substrate-binding protein n=1 Tax=Deinococcus maricopensis (strain DSM 21211 / LMG 22137 / NRRL B-23946 / LB-34) TaxID=709986 RepID=E8U4S0_DEIML|nr:hypothetical protein [Deinococcus maricopensis]ADV66059.1 putative ABC transporter substrate-binding protein [Deinococcus maricopensis DSM 21211]